MMPSLFIAHGERGIAMEQYAFEVFLRKLAASLPKPKAIVLFSEQWESPVQLISSAVQQKTMRYPAAKGDVTLSLHILHLFENEGIPCALDDEQELDDEAWVPLYHMYPDASVPVVALSVNPKLAPEEHYRIGVALAPLRQEQVLIVGSGGAVHRLLDQPGPVPQAWAQAFDEWLAEQLEVWNMEVLFHYEERAPYAREAAPLPKQMAPLLLALGAAEPAHNARLLHRSHPLGSSCWMFGGPEGQGEDGDDSDEEL